MTKDFLIRRDDIRETRFETVERPPEIRPNQLLLAIDQFALTANNITYAVAGDRMNYWDFFPAPAGWGKLPVWGFADVAQSNHPDIKVGERIYGYFPLASHLVVDAAKVNPRSFTDAAAHRQHLNAFYNQYTRTATATGFDPAFEHQNALLRPLFATSFLIDDFLFDNDFFGSDAVVISSASSKTAFGTAHQLHHNRAERASKVRVIGLTSAGNVSFVERLGWYDQVVAYADVEDQISAETAVTYVDISGNGQLRSRIHQHFADRLKYSCAVGLADWQNPARGRGRSRGLPGPRVEMFFAPAQAQKRLKEWGPADFQRRVGARLISFAQKTADFMTISVSSGEVAVVDAYSALLEGSANPSIATILSL